MKTKGFEQLKDRLDLSERTFVCLALFSIAWIAGCFALFVPVFRNFVIMFSEFLVRHSLNHPDWHGRFISWGLWGIVLYVTFFIIFFSNGLIKENLNKKLYVFVILFMVLGVFAIMFRANWTFGDDHEYIRLTAVNKYVLPQYYATNSRFVPLGHLHYNIPLFVFRLLGIGSGLPAEAHFLVIALFYSVSLICLYSLFNRIEPVKGRIHPVFSVFFACAFFFLGNTFSILFMRLIYPETPMIMLFPIFMLMYYRALETDKKRYYIVALAAAVYSSYCKEPVFGAFLVLAVSNYLFGRKNQSKREKLFYATLIANGILFFVLYYLLVFKRASVFYNEGRVSIYGLSFIVSIFKKVPLLFGMVLFGFFRFGAILLKKDRNHLYYDSLLFAGIAYTFAYMLLHLNAVYYFLPSILLFLPSLVYWIKYLYQARKNYSLPVFGIILICFFNAGTGTVPGILNTWQNRKDFIPYISNLLSEYKGGKQFIWYESDNTVSDNTFYRDVRDWRKFVENAFLNYVNKSKGKEFFVVSKNMNELGLYKNVLFFYPVDNDQNQAMPDTLVKILDDNNFELLTNSYGVLIYRQP